MSYFSDVDVKRRRIQELRRQHYTSFLVPTEKIELESLEREVTLLDPDPNWGWSLDDAGGDWTGDVGVGGDWGDSDGGGDGGGGGE